MGNVVRSRWGMVVASCLALSVPAVHAAVLDATFGTPVSQLQVPINHSRVLTLDTPLNTVSIGNPDVADIRVLDSRRIYVLGKSIGSTNVVIWNQSGGGEAYSTFSVEVTHDLDAFKRLLHQVMPEEKPEIRSSGGAIVLGGEMSSPAKVEAVNRLAEQYVKNAKVYSGGPKSVPQQSSGVQVQVSGAPTGGAGVGGGGGDKKVTETEVVNLMQVGGPHQVMLQVKVAEVSRSVLKRLGVNLAGLHMDKPWRVGAVNGGAHFPNALTPLKEEIPVFPRTGSWTGGSEPIIGPPIDKFQPNEPVISSAGLFAGFLTNNNYLELVIDASKEDGLAKILAEPTLTTTSGESATFLSGGEFPIPVWTGKSDSIAVVFKEYGISVKMLPTVLDSKRIHMVVNVNVSELSDAASIAATVPNAGVNLSIPSLTTRNATSTVELLDGETMGVAGLISDKMREVMTKFPGLGDLPVLGMLFRSQDYQQDQTELVMFVTAHLAKPIAPRDIRLPTDAFTAPSDAEFFLLGRNHGKAEPAASKQSSSDAKAPATAPNPVNGASFGHAM